jgi:hypothetical protein
MQGEWTRVFGVSQEGGNKWSIGLEVLKFFVEISFIGEDRSAGRSVHINGGILGFFFPKGGVVFLVLRDERNPDDIHKWHTRHAMYLSPNALDLVKYLRVAMSRVRGIYSGSFLMEVCLSSAVAGGLWSPCTSLA